MHVAERGVIVINCLLGLVWLLTQTTISRADPLDRWSWRYPQPQGNTLRAVTYGNGLFVAVGDAGTIVSSSDGYNWTNLTLGKFPNLLGVGYSAGVFAAVGDSGTILTSSNGVTWTQQASSTTNILRAVAGNPSFPTNFPVRFFAVGDEGTLLYGYDSVAWVDDSPAAGNTNRLRGVTVEYGGFVIVGDNGTFLPFGVTLPARNIGTNNSRAIVFGNGLFAVGGSSYRYEYYPSCPYPGCVFSHPEGTLLYFNNNSWIDSDADAWCAKEWFTISGLAFGNNRFVAVGYTAFTLEYNYPGIVMTSDTGTNWTGLPSHTSENYLYGVTFGNGLFVAVGAAGSILASSNGVDWTEITGYHRTAITALACSKDLCIASGAGAHRHYYDLRFDDFSTLVSSNGVDWVVSTTNLPPMSDLVGSGNLFVGVNGGCVYTTTNGFDWTNNCISSNTLHGVGYGNGQFFVVGDGGALYTSLDGSGWSNHSLGTTGSFNCAAYGNGLYVAAGTVVATSIDGTSWSLYPTNLPANLTRIVFGDRMFAAAGYVGPSYLPSGRLLSSQDGVTWEVRYTWEASTPASAFPGIAHGNGTFLALSSGALLKSADGINWTLGATSLPLYGGGWFPYYPYRYSPILCARQGTFIAAGMDGILMQSDDTGIPILSGSTSMTLFGFSFSFPTQSGDPFRVQATTDFTIWDSIYGNTGNGDTTTFIDLNAGSTPMRFFRVVSP